MTSSTEDHHRVLERLKTSVYFYLVLRILGVLCCIIILFSVALTNSWTSRVPAILGLVFTLLAMLFISCSIATLFAWDLQNMSLPRRSLFVWAFLLCSIAGTVLFLVAPSVCDHYNQYGCFETSYTGGFKVAAAFSIINVIFGIFDVAICFVFYFRERNDVIQPVDQRPEVTRPIPTISIIDTSEEVFNDPYRTGKSTYV